MRYDSGIVRKGHELASAALTIALAACSSTSSTSVAGHDGGAGDSSTSGKFECPAAVPSNGSPCTAPSGGFYACEYGGDAHGACTTVAQCVSQRWYVTPPAAECGTSAATCDATFGAQEVTACTNTSDTCTYAQGRCGCISCQLDGGGAGRYWHCRAWNDTASADCPSPRPLLGSACTKEGAQCAFNSCCAGPSVGPDLECKDAQWRPLVTGGCSCREPSCP